MAGTIDWEADRLEAVMSLEAIERSVAYMLGKAEEELIETVRKLHDELGGMLVAARMDLAWVEVNSTEKDERVREKIRRCAEILQSAIGFKRNLIEELRPTLLDNVGLYAALRWHLKHTCQKSGWALQERYFDPEPSFTNETSSVLFRVAQEALQLIASRRSVGKLDCSLVVTDSEIRLQLTDDDASHSKSARAGDCASDKFICMTHRVRSLGGNISIGPAELGGTEIRVVIPKERALGVATRIANGSEPGLLDAH